ncbi:hypothetical protein BJ508DRAFT_313897 [Ascobolus immersus RN42]|uniref:Uncharacterized protein n=1 Tax=Ascobolus immersus RN42 TaxID=1160509 RepID=A0A3N4HLF7_ASCIM|nr:hypothetical protein BJ508DRAFT_313897 [Ascobolus immersus RN42]
MVSPFKRLPIELRCAILLNISNWKDYNAFRCVDRINISIEPSSASLQRFIATGQPLSLLVSFHEEMKHHVLFSRLLNLCGVVLPPYNLFFPSPTHKTSDNGSIHLSSSPPSALGIIHFYHGTIRQLIKTIESPNTMHSPAPWLRYSKLLREAPRARGINSRQLCCLHDLSSAVAENIHYSMSRVLFDVLTSPPERDEKIMDIVQAHGIYIVNGFDEIVDTLSRLLESRCFQSSRFLQDFVGWMAVPLVLLAIAPSPCIVALAESVSDLLMHNTELAAVQMPPAISPFGVILTSRFMNATRLFITFVDQMIELGMYR